MKKLFCIFGLLLAAFSSEAAFISFTATNSYGAPDTNYLVLIPVSTVASGDGSFTTTGLPRRIYPDVSGVVVTNLMQNNWQVTNRFVNYVIRTPLDSGPTIYPAGQLLISSDSTGIGVFVTQQITYGGSNGIITLNQITNGLGYLPLAQTNLPSLTNGFISLLEATNVSTAFANGSSNLLYSDYTTKLAIQSALTSTTSNALYADIQIINALGLTNAFATNAAGVIYANGRIYVSTNYDALGAAATAQLQAAITATNIATNFVFHGTNGFTSIVLSNAALFAGTNLVAVTSNALAGISGISVTTATNIATNLVFLATNGMTSIVYSNAALFTGTNLLFATSNALAGQIGAAGVSAVTATNISTNQVFLGTNNLTSLARTNPAQVLYTNALPGLTNGFVDKAITNSAATIAYAQSLTNGFVDKSITDALNAAKVNITNGFSTNLALLGPHLTNGYFGGNGLFALTNAASNQTVPFFSHYDALNSDSFIIGHGGAEFFLGITNATTGSKAFIDGNLGGEIEYNAVGAPSVLGSLFHRFYIQATNGVAVKYFEVGTNGVWSTLYSGNGSGLSNLNSLQLTNTIPYSILPPQLVTNNLARPITNNFGTRIGQWMLVTNPANNSLLITNTTWGTAPPIILQTNSTVIINGFFVANDTSEFGLAAHFDADVTVDGGTIGSFIGDGSSLTNILLLGISTNGSRANQVIASIGGIPVWTNVTAVSGAVLATNGFATGLLSTNTALEGDIGFGRDGLSTNIISRTNFVAFYNAGSAVATNGAMLWSTSLGVYTNFLTGAILTNNSTAWLLQTNGVTLYSIAGTSPVGAYSAVSGAAPAPNGVYTAALNDHMIMTGYFSVSNFNQMFTNIFTNITATTTNSFIANFGGFGTNITLTNATLAWSTAPFINSVNNGGTLNFSAMSAGLAQTNTGSGGGAAVLSGATNRITLSGSSVIAGGMWNNLAGGVNNYCNIDGGLSNSIAGVDGSSVMGGIRNANSAYYSWVGGGIGNTIASSVGPSVNLGGYGNTNSGVGSVILGGATNWTGGRWSTALGVHAWVTNDYSLAWSGVDQVSQKSPTNSQAMFSGTNGIYLNGPMWLNALNTNGGIYILSNQFSLYAVTNAMPNFASWIGSSNGVLVRIYNNAGTPVMTLIP